MRWLVVLAVGLVVASACSSAGGEGAEGEPGGAGGAGLTSNEGGSDQASAGEGASASDAGGEATGLGGTSVSGGNANQPSAGAGGGQAAGGTAAARPCVEIESDYAEALDDARACTPEAAVDECTQTKSTSPGCGCPMKVNPAHATAVATLDALTTEFAAAGCDLNACPEPSTCSTLSEIACQPGSGLCSAP